MNYWYERVLEIKNKVYSNTKVETHQQISELLRDIRDEEGIVEIKKPKK